MEMQLAGAAVPFDCALIADTMPVVLGLGKVLPACTAIESDLHRMTPSVLCALDWGRAPLKSEYRTLAEFLHIFGLWQGSSPPLSG